MQSRFLTTILLALCVAHGALSIPLEVAPDAPAADDIERANEGRINAAKNLANKNILKMEHVLNNPTQPGHQEMIDAAFGKDPSLDMDKVKETVQNLKSGPAVPIKLATDPTPGVIAYTQFTGTKTPLTPSHISFGDKYHSAGTSDDARAATLIHEATHHQSDTGDNVVKGKILPGSDKKGSREKMYTSEMEPYKTAGELNADKQWTKLRDDGKTYWDEPIPATKDMHKAAEPYGQFSAMCGAAVSDAAVGLRRRAMADGNWDEAAAFLIRRQACSLKNRPKSLPKKEASTIKGLDSKKTTSQAGTAKALLSSSKSKVGGLRKKGALSKLPGGGVTKTRGKKGVTTSAIKKSKVGGIKAKGMTKGLTGSKRLGGSKAKGLTKGAKKLGASKSLAKGAKSLTRGKGGVKSRLAKGAVKGAAKGALKAKGSRKQFPVKSAAKKNVVLPKFKKPINRSAASKKVIRPTSRKANNLKKSIATKRPTGGLSSKKTKTNPRPTSNNRKTNVPKKQTKLTTTKVNTQAQAAKVAKKQAESRPAPQRQPIAKAAPKKGRRDLEFQL